MKGSTDDKITLNLIRRNARKLGHREDIDISDLESRLKVRKREILDFAYYYVDKGELKLINETLSLINVLKGRYKSELEI